MTGKWEESRGCKEEIKTAEGLCLEIYQNVSDFLRYAPKRPAARERVLGYIYSFDNRGFPEWHQLYPSKEAARHAAMQEALSQGVERAVREIRVGEVHQERIIADLTRYMPF